MKTFTQITISVLSLAALISCAQGGGSSAPAAPAKKTIDENAPEPHGRMTMQPAQKAPETTTAPEPTSGASNEPEVIETKPVSTARHPLCKESHDAGKPKIPGLTCPVCAKGNFTQPAPKRVKLDLLFVADSSPSIKSSREAIARGIQKFVDQLPAQTDYRMAVMAAHSDVSYDQKNKPSTGLAGKLLVAGKEPAVLDGSKYKLENLSELLARKLVRIPSDAASDGGELGLFSLNKGISGALLQENQRLGFFRPDAGLAVIFISDENDICSAGVNYPAGVVPKKNVNMYMKTGLTVEEKANQFYCRDQAGVPTITAVSVFEKLLSVKRIAGTDKAQPILVSGIVYTDDATIPKIPPPSEQYPEYFPEKEVGYGYVDMIKLNNGTKVDLAKGNFKEGLKAIGDAAALKLEVKTEFMLREGSAIDPNTVCVMVDGREVKPVDDFKTNVEGMSYLFQQDQRMLQLRGVGAPKEGKSISQVDVFYCEPPSVIEFDPERIVERDLPTSGEHYRNLPVPNACGSVKARIQSGALDNL